MRLSVDSWHFKLYRYFGPCEVPLTIGAYLLDWTRLVVLYSVFGVMCIALSPLLLPIWFVNFLYRHIPSGEWYNITWEDENGLKVPLKYNYHTMNMEINNDTQQR